MHRLADRRIGLLVLLGCWACMLVMEHPVRGADVDCRLCDVDANQRIERSDVQAFAGCMTGAELGPPASDCAFADLDSDGDVDQSDFGMLQRCMGEKVGPQGLLITEILADNNGALSDEDGEFSDWIEIYNAGTRDALLDGCWLTDNPAHPAMWRFPDVVLKRGAHLVVFASGKDRTIVGRELHTNFQLDKEGEYLALVMPDGFTVAGAFDPSFPKQRGNVSFGLRSTPPPPLLVGPDSPARILVPADGGLGLNWTDVGFPDSGWTPATTRIGYEHPNSDGYEHLIGTDVYALMYNRNETIYIRVPFNLTNPAALQGLTLRMKYDDGFIAYLNRTKVAERNPPATVSYNAGASASHDDAAAVVFEDIDLSGHLSVLRTGENVLAIHGLNYRRTSTDFLIVPELRGEFSEPATTYPSGELRYFSPPTPGSANGGGLTGFVGDTRFSLDRGFYTQPFQVAITTDTPGATIRFTTDGSAPSETKGTIYTGPITISTTTTLRAAAFLPEHLPSNVDTHTYLFLRDVSRQPNNPPGFPAQWGGVTNPVLAADYEMDPDIINSASYSGRVLDALNAIPSVSLVMDMPAWFDPYTGIYVNAEMEGFAWERPVSAELLYPDGREGFQVDCGVRMQGGTSPIDWKVPKISMRLLFKDLYGPKRLEFPLFADSPVTRFNTLVLDAHLHTWLHPWDAVQRRQAQYMRDAYASNLQLAAGRPSCHSLYVHLYLNGLYWGLYHVHERPDAVFCEDYFGGQEEDYDVIRHNKNDVVAGGNAAYIAMMDLATAGLSSETAYEAIQQYLDIDAFIDYMIVNLWGGNTDWAHQNWYVGRNRQPGGLFRYVSWDAEHIVKEVNHNNTTRDDGHGSPTYLHHRLRANAEYRLRFADRVHRHFFNAGFLYVDPARPAWDPAHPERNRPAALYRKLVDEIDLAIIMESARWGDFRANSDRPGYPHERDVEWVNEVNRLFTTYFPSRTATVLQQLKNQNLYPNLNAPVFSQHGGHYPVGFQLAMTASGAIRYTLDGSDPRLAGGEVSGTAVPYTAAIPLAGTVHVKARALSGATWSALTEALFVPAEPPALRVTEIMYHPPAGGSYGDEEYEFIEIQNLGSTPVELEGVSLGGGLQFVFPKSTLAAGAFIVVAGNQAAFIERYGAEPAVAGQYSGKLKNSSDTVRVSDPLGQVILECTYLDTWYPETDGLGYSLQVRDAHADPQTWSQPQTWRASTDLLGSPGRADP